MGRLGLKQVLSRVIEKKLVILGIAIIYAIIGGIYSYNYVTPMYESTSKIIISNVDYSKNTTLLNTYSEIVTSRNLLEKVKTNLKLDIEIEELEKLISISRVNSSDLLEISVLYNKSETAKKIVEEVVRLFVDSIIEVYGTNNIYIVDDANISYNPCNLNHVSDILLFSIIGVVISFVTIFVYNILNNTIKKNDDIKLNVLSIIPLNKKNKEEIISIKENKTAFADAFKTLRINIEFSKLINKEAKTLLITSVKAENKSYVAANLAITYAQTGKRVVLVDTDMKAAIQAKIFNVSNKNGLSNYIANMDAEATELNWNLEKYIKKTNVNNLKLITAGNMPANPIEFLEMPKMNELIEELKKSFDIIIFDIAPILSNAYSIVFNKLVEKTLLVCTYNNTKLNDFFEAKEKVENASGKIIGICFNKLYKNENKNVIERFKSIPNIIVNKIKNLCSNFKKSNLEKEKKREEISKKKAIEQEEKMKKDAKFAEKKLEEAKIKEAEKIIREAEKKKKIEENKEKFNEFKVDLKNKIKKIVENCSVYKKEISEKFAIKKSEILKKYEEYKIKRDEENKIKQEQKAIKDAEKAKHYEENRIKKEERKVELAKERERIQAEIAIKKEEERIIKEAEKQKRAEEKAMEQARIEEERAIKQAQLVEEKQKQAIEKAKRDAEIAKKKEEEKIRREAERIKQAEEKAKREAEIIAEKVQKEAENLRIREEEKVRRAREKEDAKYTDEYLEDNLYPKTKYNKF